MHKQGTCLPDVWTDKFIAAIPIAQADLLVAELEAFPDFKCIVVDESLLYGQDWFELVIQSIENRYPYDPYISKQVENLAIPNSTAFSSAGLRRRTLKNLFQYLSQEGKLLVYIKNPLEKTDFSELLHLGHLINENVGIYCHVRSSDEVPSLEPPIIKFYAMKEVINPNNPVYISYSRKDSSTIADLVVAGLEQEGIKVKHDIRDNGPNNSIKEFEKEIEDLEDYKMLKRIITALAVILLTLSCAQKPAQQPLENSVVYEMNVRQYTPEGTFAAAQQELPRLKELGIDILWLMPIHPIGVKERKGTLGSYYAIADYKAINSEFGTMEDFENFLAEAHKLGFRVILDCVANHTSPEAKWINECPADWYMRDSLGNTVVNYDWYDIAELNYGKREVWDAMADQMRFWMEKGVDGFRCDMACEVPLEFWQETISALRADYPGMYMLAEGEEPQLHSISGFNSSYAWELHHMLNAIARGEKNIPELLEYIQKDAERHPADAFRLMFTSNHDENSWAGTEFERMGDAAKLMAVLTFTLPNGQPLIYTGQEMGWNKRFEFFEKDPIPAWEKNEFFDFYKWLIDIRHSNPALAAGDKGGKFEVVSTDDSTLIFTRTLPENKVTVKAELKAPWSYEIITE